MHGAVVPYLITLTSPVCTDVAFVARGAPNQLVWAKNGKRDCGRLSMPSSTTIPMMCTSWHRKKYHLLKVHILDVVSQCLKLSQTFEGGVAVELSGLELEGASLK